LTLLVFCGVLTPDAEAAVPFSSDPHSPQEGHLPAHEAEDAPQAEQKYRTDSAFAIPLASQLSVSLPLSPVERLYTFTIQ
jgi:hypothetical protein